MEKAYDMIWKRKVIELMADYKIGGNMIKFVANFLKKRYFRVKINGTLSDCLETENGVPQGSAISVTLFLIVINLFKNCIQKPVSYSGFADDCTVLVAGKNPKTTTQLLQKTINQLETLNRRTGFRFSKTKTVLAIFSKAALDLEEFQINIGNTVVEIVDTVKILGLTFDAHLKWNTHIKSLKNECIRRLSVLKCISSKNWGADLEIINNTYKSLIRTKLDYGSIAYNSARKSLLKTLEPVQNAAARIITGAFRTSPVLAILSEAKLPPLHIRRMQTTLNYATSIAATPDNPVFKLIFKNSSINYSPFKAHISIHARVELYLKSVEKSIGPVLPQMQLNSPPWLAEPMVILDDQFPSVKNEMNTTTIQQIFSNIKSNFSDHTPIFTDGSKSKNGTGCAILINGEIQKYKLPASWSVFSAEAHAVSKAVDSIALMDMNKFIIFSDSKSILSALKEVNSKNTAIKSINNKLLDLKHRNKIDSIVIAWIPSHCGIKENEIVNQAAKEAAAMSNDTVNIEPHPHTEKKKELSSAINEYWNELWKKAPALKIHEFVQNFFDNRPTLDVTRKEQVILTRLKIGHTNLTHIHLITKDKPNKCEKCAVSLSVKHLLLECADLAEERKSCNLPIEYSNYFAKKKSCYSVLELLKRTKFFHSI
ncbi:uncharacterized protein LOC131666073 [Phymastichus coffea]|uniref:uncharacterized protein LOC131666073 n=1 Tax=Phymastichus coffea TaxID=108790 RepID=UPI00273CC782|nr:uncharacterized protein LOC131666073 [Phymastichus coffea]